MRPAPWLAALLLLLLALPCAAAAQETLKPAPEDKVSADVKLVVAAVLQQFSTNPQLVDGVRFDPAGTHLLHDPKLDLTGFDVTNIVINQYTIKPLSPKLARILMQAVFEFRDPFGRTARLAAAIQYVLYTKGINIEHSAAIVAPPETPTLETYYVPADEFQKAVVDKTSFQDYYLAILTHAVPMTDVPNPPEAGKGTYLVITLCKDLLPPESLLTMKVTNKPRRLGLKLARPVYLLMENKWRMILAGGRFDPGTRGSKFYTTITYAKVDGVDEPVIVGSYDNKRDTLPALPASQAKTAPAPTPAAPAPSVAKPGPLEMGTTMLNPIFLSDAKVLHVRLKQLGYYKGAIDSPYDTPTIEAINAFAKNNGLPSDGQWSLELQKALFKGTGQ